jgi:hypothetical protein
MTLVWKTGRHAVKLAAPRPDVTICVMKWSKLWGWTIRRESLCLVRGCADTAKLAQADAEAAWETIKTGQTIVGLQTFDRRPIDPRNRYWTGTLPYRIPMRSQET